MIGDMIAKARKEKGVTKTELARLTDINIGHLTHIEKGERHPSHRTLKSICKSLDIPYQSLMHTYDRTISEAQESYHVMDHITYDKILAFDSISDFIECPSDVPGASLAVKFPDESMQPFISKGTYVYIELNCPLNHKELGVFHVNGKIYMRRFILKKGGKITLRADNKDFEDIVISDKDSFYIIGKFSK